MGDYKNYQDEIESMQKSNAGMERMAAVAVESVIAQVAEMCRDKEASPKTKAILDGLNKKLQSIAADNTISSLDKADKVVGAIARAHDEIRALPSMSSKVFGFNKSPRADKLQNICNEFHDDLVKMQKTQKGQKINRDHFEAEVKDVKPAKKMDTGLLERCWLAIKQGYQANLEAIETLQRLRAAAPVESKYGNKGAHTESKYGSPDNDQAAPAPRKPSR